MPLDQNVSSRPQTRDNLILIGIALATVIIHLLVGNRYGFHRDELQTYTDALHLDWGFVAYPPITPLFARLSLALFGTSLAGFRFFASIAEAIAVVLAGLMARELGGRRGAQLAAAAAGIPFCLLAGSLMQYVSFDYLGWVLTAYFIVRLLRSGDARWWLAIGAAIAFGMMAKYGMAFFVAGIVGGVLLTGARAYFRSKWLYLGIALCVVVCLPNLIWQAKHDYISLDFLRHIHARDVRIGRTKDFLPDQLKLTFLAFPLALAGLYFYFFAPAGKRFRVLGWMYIFPLVIFTFAKGRGYYLAAAYPMLYAAGAVQGEQWLSRLQKRWQAVSLRSLAWAALIFDIFLFGALLLPIAQPGTRWFATITKVQGDFVEEFGWQQLVASVAQVRDTIPEAERSRLAVMAGNYGEVGALDLYGPRYNLPRTISGVNTSWLRGYGDPPPQTLIVVGISEKYLNVNFGSCQFAARIPAPPFGIENEESHDNHDIFICRGLKSSWPAFWKDFRYFG